MLKLVQRPKSPNWVMRGTVRGDFRKEAHQPVGPIERGNHHSDGHPYQVGKSHHGEAEKQNPDGNYYHRSASVYPSTLLANAGEQRPA